MARRRFRDSDPVEEILRIAMQNQGGVDAALRQRLLSSACDLGISEEAALAAQRQWEEQNKERDLMAGYRSNIQRDFLTHLGVFIVINVILAIINRLTSEYPWVIWPVLTWGIGLGCHAVWTLIQSKSPGGEEFESWKRRHEDEKPSGEALGSRSYGLGIHIHSSPRATMPSEPPSDNRV